jgi:hypothetical protein
MNQKKKIPLSVWMLLCWVLSASPCFGLDDSSQVFLGFIENGTWHEKGAIYLQVKPAEYSDDLLSEKQKNELMEKQYLEIPDNIAKKFSHLMPEQSLDVYSENGYLGAFKISQFVILVSACTENHYLYAKLDHKADQLQNLPCRVVARVENKGSKKQIGKVYQNQILLGPEKVRLEKILSEKLKYARVKVLGPEFKLSEQKANQRFEFDLEYKAFKIGDSQDKKGQWVIQAVWICRDDQLASGIGYYLTNIFMVSGDDQIKEWEPLQWSLDEFFDVKRIEFGIEFEPNQPKQWLIRHEKWEWESYELYEWGNGPRRNLVEEEGFGC